MDVSYIHLEDIVSDWLDLTGHDGFFNTDQVLKDAQDETNKLVRGEQAKQHIALLKVENHKTELPSNFKSIVQVAYNIFPQKPVLKSDVSQYTQKMFDSDCELKINLECPACHKTSCDCESSVIEVNADEFYRTNNPQHYVSHMKHFYSYTNMTEYPNDKMCYYHPQFKLMGRAAGSFHNLKYHISDCINLNLDTDISYQLDIPYLITNFKEGQVLLSYFGFKMGEKGLMIPNLPEAISAITLYIESRDAFRKYRKSRKSIDRSFYYDVKTEYEIAHKKAKTLLERPDADKMSMIWRNTMKKLMPYWDQTKNLNRKQDDQFRYPRQTSGLIH